MDDAKRCTITIGPCEDSLFVRDCEDCVVHAVCRQLRTRNCVRCKFYLWVLTDPIIESSHSCEFGEWHTAYPRLDAHFKAANLDANEENLCHKIYDFTPDEPNAPHWTEALPQPERVIEVAGMESPPVNPAVTKIAAPPPAVQPTLPPEPPPRDGAERPLPPDPPAVQVEYASTDDSSSDEAFAIGGAKASPADKRAAVGTTVESFVHEGGPGFSQSIDITFKGESLGLSLVGCDDTGAVVASPDVVCAAVIVTAIKPESELHGVGVDIRGRQVCAVDGKAVKGLSFHETIERILAVERPITISFGTPPFTLGEGCAAMAVQSKPAADEPELVPESGGGVSEDDGLASQSQSQDDIAEQLPYRLTSDTGSYVALDTVGFLGQSIRAAAYEDSRRYGRVRKGMQLHALSTLVRRRTDNPVVPGENPRKFLEDETLSEVWIKIHYLAAPRCEGWALVRRGTKVYMEKQDDPTSPTAGPSSRAEQLVQEWSAGGSNAPKQLAAEALTSGKKLLSKFKTKKGISRKEAEHVRQLILERERESMRELVANELEERGIEVVQAPVVPHYQAVAVVSGGEKMNVDVGGLGVMSVTVPKNCQKGDTFLFTIPKADQTNDGAPTSAPTDADDLGGDGKSTHKWIAATKLDVGDFVDVMPSDMAKPAVEEAGLKFNKAREKQCEARGVVTEITMSGNVKVKFTTPVNGPDGELLRTDTAHLIFPLTALASAEPEGPSRVDPHTKTVKELREHAAAIGACADDIEEARDAGDPQLALQELIDATELAKEKQAARLHLTGMGRTTSTDASPASDASGTPAGVANSATVGRIGRVENKFEDDTPPTPGTPTADPPAVETPARGHLTGLDAGEIEVELNSGVNADAEAATAAAKAAQAARLAELEQAQPEPEPMSAAPASIPAGWEKDVSRTTGQIYYINSFTGESTYDPPTEAATPPELSEGMQLMQEAQALAGKDQWAACVETVRRAIVRSTWIFDSIMHVFSARLYRLPNTWPCSCVVDLYGCCMQEAGVEEVAAALYLEGVAQAEQGNLAEAVHALRQCVQAEPEHGECSQQQCQVAFCVNQS